VSLICRDISYAYNGADVLHEVGLTVSQGTFCALLGRNGSGKTTLLHCICGILRPLRGEIVVNGRPVPAKNGAQRARCLSLVPQEPGHVFPFTVLDLVLMGRNPYLPAGAQPGPEDKRIAWQALEILHAEYLASRRVNQISGGERQLAVVARALAQQTPVMLLDEPSNHLDFHNQYRLLYQIRSLCRTKNLTVLASMHDPNTVAAVADQVVLLEDGREAGQGSVDQMLTSQRLSSLYGMPIAESRLDSGIKHFMPRLETDL
jgi:iron complex transport system ATP-binding protein